MLSIPHSKPYITGNEFQYIESAISNRHLSGNGKYTNLCQHFFKEKYGFKKCLLTTSCTDALEMCAILLDIKPGDEVIMPSFTFVSTANAFILRGAKIVLADSNLLNPNIEESDIEKLITKNTKAIVVVHYAGIACNMEAIMAIANKHQVFVIEDAAQAIDSFFTDSVGEKKILGSIGHLAAFSFHESKNIQCGEGGLLVINDERFNARSEIIWEKGTNRAAFFRGEVDKYNWVDVGSSFLPSEITAAFLYAQLLALDDIQMKRKENWQLYYEGLLPLQANQKIGLPYIPDYATNNAHIFYVLCKSLEQRDELILFLKKAGVQLMFHYPGLHTSPFYLHNQEYVTVLENAEQFSDCLVRLPLYVELDSEKINFIIRLIYEFFE
ncbi:dTDP-4-amino-4,6-dideoxygalactose transaminase [Ferruginibacter sp.]|nr:dTDP-4-amino-4,6-dideoxygalactose transaminase [Ferruginibacter sp.]